MIISSRYIVGMTNDTYVRDLINRLARLDSAHAWAGDLNPTQLAMLGYLGQANQYSRSPSHVASYLGTTRGTVTQSLKSLQQKGYVTERRSEKDRRAISYALTEIGRNVSNTRAPLQEALSSLGSKKTQTIRDVLEAVLSEVLANNKGREFGLCKNCKHHKVRDDGPYCSLMGVALARNEAEQICHEQVNAS